MHDSEMLSHLIGLAYAGGSRADAWPRFLDELAAAIEIESIDFVQASTVDGRVHSEITLSSGFDPDMLKSYEEHYHEVDPWVAAGVLDLPAGHVGESVALVPQAEFEQTEFYNDLYRVHGFRDGFGATIRNDGDGFVTAIGFHRAATNTSDHAPQLETVKLLVPHVQRALEICWRLEFVDAERAVGAELLDRVPIGAMLVDEHGGVVQTNRHADRILAARDGLRSESGGLRAGRCTDDHRLQRCIGEAAATSAGHGTGPGGAFFLPRPSGRPSLHLVVGPLARETPDSLLPNALAIVLVSDGEDSRHTSSDLLRQLYGLTPAEAALASLLVDGCSLQEAADARGIGIETARSHLKQVFLKTDTTRQADLIRRLLIGPAGFGD